MGMWWGLFALPLPPTPTVHSNCKSNMAGRINDRELITLARTNKTPALQASQDRELSIFVSSTTEISQYALRHSTVTFFMTIFFFLRSRLAGSNGFLRPRSRPRSPLNTDRCVPHTGLYGSLFDER